MNIFNGVPCTVDNFKNPQFNENTFNNGSLRTWAIFQEMGNVDNNWLTFKSLLKYVEHADKTTLWALTLCLSQESVTSTKSSWPSNTSNSEMMLSEWLFQRRQYCCPLSDSPISSAATKVTRNLNYNQRQNTKLSSFTSYLYIPEVDRWAWLHRTRLIRTHFNTQCVNF